MLEHDPAATYYILQELFLLLCFYMKNKATMFTMFLCVIFLYLTVYVYMDLLLSCFSVCVSDPELEVTIGTAKQEPGMSVLALLDLIKTFI